MHKLTYGQCLRENFLGDWDNLNRIKKPVIAAVNGYALGGGCELAMMCDIIYAGDEAKFSQNEIVIGTIPGSGGTQRLTRTIGKYKTMELILTGDQITAQEAETLGIVCKVFPPELLLDETLKLAEKIAKRSRVSLTFSKEHVNRALETSLSEGMLGERKTFHAMFATKDCKEGMKAFLEKRSPQFVDE